MKNIISRIMILAMLASFAACSSELDNAGGYAGDEAMVRMNFTGLNGFAVTRAVDQTAVEKVTVYLFEGTEESSELKYTLPVTLSNKTDAGLPGSFKVPEGGTYHVEAIANAEILTGISTYGDFLAQTTTAAFDGNLLMQGATAQDITLTGGQTTTLSMELVRLAATFQVVGADEADVSDVAFTLKGAVKESYLVKHADGDSFTIPADAETGENAVPYSYENPENSTVMVITGTMNGAAYRTEVPVVQVLRNHLYTVKLVNNSGTIEPELTVTDWSEISSSLEIGAGSALMMTAATDKTQDPEATVVYPEEEDLKSTQTVNVAADAAVTYYLYVKSANIEAVLTHTTLPDGWTLAAPAETRTDYLWEKGYWTLTIPANATSEVRTLTVTATNKLIADATVSITLTQEGVEEEGSNPGDMGNWGGEDQNPSYVQGTLTKVANADGWTVNVNIYGNGGFATMNTYTNGIKNGVLTSNHNTDAHFFQWGRYLGFPSSTGRTHFNSGGSASGSYPNSSQAILGISLYNTKFGYLFDSGLGASYGCCWMGNDSWTEQRVINCSIIFGKVSGVSVNPLDYCGSNSNYTWEQRGGNPCPVGYRVPTADELSVLIPTGGEVNGSCAEVKVIDGVKYAMQWKVVSASTPYVEITSVKTNSDNVTVDDAIFNNASSIRLYAYGYLNNEAELDGKGTTGVYWSSESAANTMFGTNGYGAKFLELDFASGKVDMYIDVAPRCFGGCVLPIKDAEVTEQVTVTPWLPLSGL